MNDTDTAAPPPENFRAWARGAANLLGPLGSGEDYEAALDYLISEEALAPDDDGRPAYITDGPRGRASAASRTRRAGVLIWALYKAAFDLEVSDAPERYVRVYASARPARNMGEAVGVLTTRPGLPPVAGADRLVFHAPYVPLQSLCARSEAELVALHAYLLRAAVPGPGEDPNTRVPSGDAPARPQGTPPEVQEGGRYRWVRDEFGLFKTGFFFASFPFEARTEKRVSAQGAGPVSYVLVVEAGLGGAPLARREVPIEDPEDAAQREAAISSVAGDVASQARKNHPDTPPNGSPPDEQ